MIEYTARAARQIVDLRKHYEAHERIEAIHALAAALAEAERRIARSPTAGAPAPRPYPDMARPGLGWIKAGRY